MTHQPFDDLQFVLWWCNVRVNAWPEVWRIAFEWKKSLEAPAGVKPASIA